MYTSLLMLTLAATPADSVRVLDPVVVSATRSETRLDKIPQKLVTISGQDMALVPAADLPDLLKKTAAVNIIQYRMYLSLATELPVIFNRKTVSLILDPGNQPERLRGLINRNLLVMVI